jgi:hypothetical protein
VAVAWSVSYPSRTSAQIISTMLPPESTSAPPGVSRTYAFHFMGGFADWETSFDPGVIQALNALGDLHGHEGHGFILAGDMTFRAGRDLTAGVGGWYNRVTPVVGSFPEFGSLEFDMGSSYYAFYGNVFYRYIGVQAGLIPIQRHVTLKDPGHAFTDHYGEIDGNVFVVGRIARAKWFGTLGGGFYRYGEQPPIDLFQLPGLPAAVGFSWFGNASLALGKGLWVDASIWRTGKTRLTIGVGFSR